MESPTVAVQNLRGPKHWVLREAAPTAKVFWEGVNEDLNTPHPALSCQLFAVNTHCYVGTNACEPGFCVAGIVCVSWIVSTRISPSSTATAHFFHTPQVFPVCNSRLIHSFPLHHQSHMEHIAVWHSTCYSTATRVCKCKMCHLPCLMTGDGIPSG
jgi:hypothetical protein